VDVVTDVDLRTVAHQHLALARAPDTPFDHVDVEPEVVDVQLGVGGVLARDQDDPASVAAYGGQGVGHGGKRRGRFHGEVGVDLAEPVGGRVDQLGSEMGLQQEVEGRAELRGHLRRRELHPELGTECVQGRREADGGVDQRHVEVEPDDETVPHRVGAHPALARLVLAHPVLAHPVRVGRGADGDHIDSSRRIVEQSIG
jgi:hypothetical protein